MSKNPGRHIFGVGELTRQIRQGIEALFTNIWVEGEVSNYTQSSLGHIYFILKDKYSQIKVAIFKNQLRYLKIRPKDGMQIIIHGNISVYEKRGEYQLVGDYIEPKGIGSLQLAFEELKNRLQKEGLFSETHKKPLPFLPRTIGIVTSPTGAVIHDILSVSLRRFPNLNIIINPVPVQGDGAAEIIAKAIEEIDSIPEVEVIILARGGGSLEDLFCFNEEIVARAIFAAKKPIVSAIGHEVDFTIADFVADLRAPTPSAAAELVVRNKQQLTDQLIQFQELLNIKLHQLITRSRQHFLEIKQSHVFISPKSLFITQKQQQIDDLNQRLTATLNLSINQHKMEVHKYHKNILMYQPVEKLNESKRSLQHLGYKLEQNMVHYITNKKNQLSNLSSTIDALSPLRVLKRGYSICQKLPTYELIKDARTIQLNDFLELTLYKGKLICQVNEKKE